MRLPLFTNLICWILNIKCMKIVRKKSNISRYGLNLRDWTNYQPFYVRYWAGYQIQYQPNLTTVIRYLPETQCPAFSWYVAKGQGWISGRTLLNSPTKVSFLGGPGNFESTLRSRSTSPTSTPTRSTVDILPVHGMNTLIDMAT